MAETGKKKTSSQQRDEDRVTTQFYLHVTAQASIGTPACALIPHLCNGRSRAALLFGKPDSEAMFSKFSRAPFHPPELSLAVPSAYSSLHSHYVSWNKYTTRFFCVSRKILKGMGVGGSFYQISLHLRMIFIFCRKIIGTLI